LPQPLDVVSHMRRLGVEAITLAQRFNIRMPSSRRVFLLWPLLGLISSQCVRAQSPEPASKIGGASFERRAKVAATELLLNGVGMRAVAWFKAYAAGLYLVARASTAEQVVAASGPKRLQLRMLRDLPAAEFVKAFKNGMTRNTTPEGLSQLAARIERFAQAVAAIGNLRGADVVNLDFDPARGTLFTLNGTPRGDVIEGPDFYATLLRAFVGDQPYDEKLKAGLLGRAA
jgi:Chalcone isomerase-like